ncbi:MAG: alpha-amylase family glycosyl hydrolase [bacterium]|nr:alpha-amylase family glycosyl hydrolase [bacterium]
MNIGDISFASRAIYASPVSASPAQAASVSSANAEAVSVETADSVSFSSQEVSARTVRHSSSKHVSSASSESKSGSIPSRLFSGDINRAESAQEKQLRADIASAHSDWPSVTFTYDASQLEHVNNITLKGSFNPETGIKDGNWNGGKGIAMFDDGTHGDEIAGDGIYSASVAFDPSQSGQVFQWGVTGDVHRTDGSVQKDQRIIMSEDARAVELDGSKQPQTEAYAPATAHTMGVHYKGEDGISFKTWAPATGTGELANYAMHVDIYDEHTGELIKSLPMEKDEKTGNWSLDIQGRKELEGKAYRYSAKDADGNVLKTKNGSEVSYSDPYARYMQGQQRGLERIFVDPVHGIETGWYNDSGSGGPNYTVNPHWGRFTVNDHPNADKVVLVFKDENGNQLTKQQLLDRLGEPGLIDYNNATPEQKRNADLLKSWQLDLSGKVTDYKWTNNVGEDGSIEMTKAGGGNVTGGWVSTVNNFPKLEGLSYEFQVYEDGKLLGDANNDGKLSNAERIGTAYNDPYSNTISARPGSERMSLIKESGFQFKYHDVPRLEKDPDKYTIYEAHVGSFRTTKDNAVPTKFSDMVKYLDYIADLGYNSVEIMPFNEFGGKRDWGYTPDFYFAGAEAYGFEMPRAEAVERGIIRADQDTDKESVWVSGTDAVKVFVDESHKKGLNVICDVVYNHTSGKTDGDNALWQIDGDQNSFFNWGGGKHSETPWGTKPNYSADGVKNFYADNALQQIREFGVDGIRFDFAQVLHDSGTADEQIEGMNTLRQINRTLALFDPDGKPFTVAEDFTQNWLVAADLDQGENQWGMEKKGMGFDGVWSGPVHHDLIGAIEGKKNMDNLMDTMLSHKGVNAPNKAVIFSHSHDEVGNSGTWTIRTGAGSRDDGKVMENYPRAIGRAAAAIIHTMPGVPMVFQGEEFLANNDFKHGATSTWGADYSWLDFRVSPAKLDSFKEIAKMAPADQKAALKQLSSDDKESFVKYMAMDDKGKADAEIFSLKTGQSNVYRELNELRKSSNAFNADSPMNRIYTHNDNKATAYERTDGKDRFIVVTNFSGNDYSNYRIDGMPAGNWKEVFNSNARDFGGTGFGNFGGTGAFNEGMNIPAGSSVIFKLT